MVGDETDSDEKRRWLVGAAARVSLRICIVVARHLNLQHQFTPYQ